MSYCPHLYTRGLDILCCVHRQVYTGVGFYCWEQALCGSWGVENKVWKQQSPEWVLGPGLLVVHQTGASQALLDCSGCPCPFWLPVCSLPPHQATLYFPLGLIPRAPYYFTHKYFSSFIHSVFCICSWPIWAKWRGRKLI